MTEKTQTELEIEAGRRRLELRMGGTSGNSIDNRTHAEMEAGRRRLANFRLQTGAQDPVSEKDPAGDGQFEGVTIHASAETQAAMDAAVIIPDNASVPASTPVPTPTEKPTASRKKASAKAPAKAPASKDTAPPASEPAPSAGDNTSGEAPPAGEGEVKSPTDFDSDLKALLG